MTGFEPRTSGIGSDRSTNWATTTAQKLLTFFDYHSVAVLLQRIQLKISSHLEIWWARLKLMEIDNSTSSTLDQKPFTN